MILQLLVEIRNFFTLDGITARQEVFNLNFSLYRQTGFRELLIALYVMAFQIYVEGV
jgi:hypothetical protein